MKVLYVLDSNISIKTGVLKKISESVTTWVKYGITSYVLEYPTGALYDHNLKSIVGPLFNEEIANKRIDWLAIFNKRSLGISHAIEKVLPDITYFREIIWTPRLFKYLKKTRYVVEINSIAVTEIRKRSRAASIYWKINQYLLY